MKLLVTTQILDRKDPILGFFHSWVEELAKHCEQVEVICLFEGEHALPNNVCVHSLGKEKNPSLLGRRFLFIFRFWKLIWKLNSSYDSVLVHMNPEYILLGGLWWRLTKKRIGLWYVHKNVSLHLRLATLLTNLVFTASKESFRLPSSKVRVLGHGINISQWQVPHKESLGILRIITTGRIGPAKRIREMLFMVEELSSRGIQTRLTIVGVPVTDKEKRYAAEIEVEAKKYAEKVRLLGGVPQADLPLLLGDADVFLNLSSTGSLDKAVLEALVAGVPVVSSNEAFKGMLVPHGLFLEKIDGKTVADTVLLARKVNISDLVSEIERKHSLSTLIPRIVRELSSI